MANMKLQYLVLVVFALFCTYSTLAAAQVLELDYEDTDSMLFNVDDVAVIPQPIHDESHRSLLVDDSADPLLSSSKKSPPKAPKSPPLKSPPKAPKSPPLKSPPKAPKRPPPKKPPPPSKRAPPPRRSPPPPINKCGYDVCKSKETCCNKKCVDTTKDASNCGVCGKKCKAPMPGFKYGGKKVTKPTCMKGMCLGDY